jgi:hypothetical protein
MLPTNLPSLSFRPKRRNPGFNNWLGHLPFARDLIGGVRPSTFVELGTHLGESYFGCCQAMTEAGVECACYAVDTWKGDEHAGAYGEEVFDDVRRYNDEHYAASSRLLRMTFDQAVTHFDDNSLDLLHIDGLHTYDAIAHDFDTWFPKLRPGGVVMLHDVAAKQEGFEVWRFWEELQGKFSTFAFREHSGLGVLRKPEISGHRDDFLSELLTAGPKEQEDVREYYRVCGEWLLAEESTRCRTLQELLSEKEQQFADANTRLNEKTGQAAHFKNLLDEMEQKAAHYKNLLDEREQQAAHYKNLFDEMEQKFRDAQTRLTEKTAEGQHFRNLLALEEDRHRVDKEELAALKKRVSKLPLRLLLR